MTNLFWIRSQNFGDALNPLLHKAITGYEPTFSAPENEGTVIAIGSLAHCARAGNVLWGTGAMADDMPLQCNQYTHARAIRGPLTAWLLRKAGVDISDAIFMDPAILVPRFFPCKEKVEEAKILIVPHYVDFEIAGKMEWRSDCKLLSPMSPAETIIHEIACAYSVVTSSLHILEVAEAFSVPAVWVEFSDNVRGNGFKFMDWYLSTLRQPPNPVQIRGKPIPWSLVYYGMDNWTAPRVELETMAQMLLDRCPFSV